MVHFLSYSIKSLKEGEAIYKYLHTSTEEEFKKDTENMYRHEFTVTYSPRYIPDKEYAHTLTTHVIDDIFHWCIRNNKVQRCRDYNEFTFCYVVELQKNGWPHIHGTFCTQHPMRPVSVRNLESSLIRKYGKTDIYATGKVDYYHKEKPDWEGGPWSEYIKKEGKVKYFKWGGEKNNSIITLFH